MTSSPIVVVGASAGGIEALQHLVSGLPRDFPAAVCVVLHVQPHSRSALPDILSRAGALRAVHATDGEPITSGCIYVASPDHHLLVEGETLGVKRGPKENRFRPAVDTLFRSSAYTRGAGVIGVILSGVLDDGTSGLWTIKQLGGTAIAQDPADAAFDTMPRSAIDQVRVDHTVSARGMGPLLDRLVRAGADPQIRPSGERTTVGEREWEQLGAEVGIAASGPTSPATVGRFGPYSPFTCPECHGALVQIEEGGRTRFRCHTGHAYTSAALLAELSEEIEARLYQTLRTMEEAILLLERMDGRVGPWAGRHDALGDQARLLQERANVIQQLALSGRMLRGGHTAQEPNGEQPDVEPSACTPRGPRS